MTTLTGQLSQDLESLRSKTCCVHPLLSMIKSWAVFGLLVALVHTAAAAPAKWTFFVYMLADNDLEQYGLLDMEVRTMLPLSSTLVFP